MEVVTERKTTRVTGSAVPYTLFGTHRQSTRYKTDIQPGAGSFFDLLCNEIKAYLIYSQRLFLSHSYSQPSNAGLHTMRTALFLPASTGPRRVFPCDFALKYHLMYDSKASQAAPWRSPSLMWIWTTRMSTTNRDTTEGPAGPRDMFTSQTQDTQDIRPLHRPIALPDDLRGRSPMSQASL